MLAERGTPTAAALLTTFTSPAPGHAPILVVVGEDKDHYEPVWPPTIMINKETALEPHHQKITWGAGQLGIAQGVLDAVAEGLIPCSGDLHRVRRDLHRPERHRRDRGRASPAARRR